MDRRTEWKALDARVLVVAVEGSVKDWAAYIGSVPGHNHANEWKLVASEGSKLSYALAKFLFPKFDEAFTWRE